MQRAYSVFDVKSVDDDLRIIAGIASTPEPDRMGDIVEPKGATFSLPIPLLWQHRSDQPIGHVIAATVTNAGIEIKAQIAKGLDIPDIDRAWKLIKSGLVRGLSIGFRATEDPELIKDSWGLRFAKWEWLELSAVTIPANADASIMTVRQFDTKAASGQPSVKPAGVSASRAVKAAPKDRDVKNKITDQIKGFEATLLAKTSERDEIMDKASEAGETLDADQSEKYDTLSAEIKSLNAHLMRLREREKEQLEQAKVVETAKTPRDGVEIKHSIVMGEHRGTSEPGLGLARVAICKAASWMSRMRGDADTPAFEIAKSRFPHDPRVVNYLKTGVIGINTQDTNSASVLAPTNTIGTDFIAYLRGKTIIDSFGQNGIPALRPLPFNVKVPRQTTGGTGYWVGEGKPKPVTKFQFDTITMDYTKAAALAVITQELILYSIDNADAIVREQLAQACIARLDTDIVDPAKAISSHVNPASLTNGVTSKATAGTSAANVLTDVEKLVAPFLNNNYNPSTLVLIMPNTLCLALSLMVTTNGVRQFPNIEVSGGNLCGLPVIASQYAGSLASYGNMVICVSTADVGLADTGTVDVSISSEASLQMDDSPTNDTVTPTATSLVSMFQTNSVAILAERRINWTKLRSTSVTWMQDVNWGAVGSPRNT